MAKLTAHQWQTIREDYEVRCKSTIALAKEYGVADTTIQRRLKKDNWSREKTQYAIDAQVKATKAFTELTQENAGVAQVASAEVTERLELEGYFTNSIKLNQSMANKKLKAAGANAELADLDIHSRLTNRNKDGLLGKTPQTQVNIQNNVGSDADAIVERLRNKHS